MKRRWRVCVGLVVIAVTAGGLVGLARASGGVRGPSNDPVRILRIYYQAPVLVHAGQRVLLPVHVVCATAGGRACRAAVSLGVRAGTGDAWRFQTVPADPRLTFDLSAPAARAAASAGDHSVAFMLQARAEDTTAFLPGRGARTPLRFYVTPSIRTLNVPTIAFGRTKRGRPVLWLPWGSGPTRAGVAIGRESATLGPPSFDVDAAGRIHLLDALQRRIAEFDDQQMLRQLTIATGFRADLAVTTRGGAYVADAPGGFLRVARLRPSGAVVGPERLGPGILSQLRAVGSAAYAEILPLDAWVLVSGPRGRSSAPSPIAGRPLPGGGNLLRVGTERYVRLAVVRDGVARGAVELRSSERFGEVALAEADRSGGYVVVVRVWRWGPRSRDQYQVIHVAKGRIVETFAVSSRSFADPAPLSRFRLGPGGGLYQLVTTPAGVRIVRFELEEGS